MFEQDVKAFLRDKQITFHDGTKSTSALDFFLPRYNIHFDVKEKTQAFSLKNWSEATAPQADLFIMDDLAARKLLRCAPLSFCIIRDSSNPPVMYYVYSVVDLMCVPKKRVRRPIARSVKTFKGKWMLNLRDAAAFDSLADAMKYMLSYNKKFPAIFGGHIDCWGRYPSEQIPVSGGTRTPTHWQKDSRLHS
jgi:hypothetical protein